MVSTRADHRRDQIRTYDRSSSVVFLKTKEAFGGLSNMAGGFPLRVNGIDIRTSEALYQACRFPHLPDLQRLIIEQRSPMTAKMKSKPYRRDSRRDWNRIRVNVMRWCLRVKLAQNWDTFSELLSDTGARPIVEHSRKDDFWGAIPAGEQTLVGVNALGRLLMELREFVRTETREKLLRVEPLQIDDFLLGGRPIELVTAAASARTRPIEGAPSFSSRLQIPKPVGVQLPLPRSPKTASGAVRENALKYGESELQAGLKRYPAYKDSRVEWLERVPAHWDISTLRRRLRPTAGIKIGPFGSQLKLEHMTPSGYKVYGQANVISRDFARGTKFIDQTKFDELTACEVLPGDLLITMMGTSGRCAGVPRDAAAGIMDSHLLRLRPDASVNPRFVSLLIDESPYVKDQIAVAGKGSVMHGLNSGMVKALVLALPSLVEQAAIVRFLDHADRRIRRYIRAKQKLIALLEEQKQVVIQQAVTGRIDVRTGRPYPAYKTSGVEWLERVPEEWEVLRLGRLVSLTVGFPFKSDRFTQSNGDVRLLRGVNIAPGRIRWKDVVRWAASDTWRFEQYRLRVGDIVLGMDRPAVGGGVRVAAVTEADVPSLLLQRVARIRPKQRLLKELAIYLLASRRFSDYLTPIFTGVSVPHLSPEQIRAFPVALPSKDEQVRIVDYLRSDLDALHAAVESAHEEIALISDYRTRLIADVVTGKLDVRVTAAVLPEAELTRDDDAEGAIHSGNNVSLDEPDTASEAEL